LEKAPEAFRTISEVAEELDVPQHVLRFWESRFHEIRPMKRGGGRRYYRPQDVDLLRGIRHLLYGEGYTIRGVQRVLREQGHRFVQSVWQAGAPQPTPKEDGREPARPTGGQAAASQTDQGGTDDTLVEFPSSAAEEGRLSQAQVQKLRAALQELSECRRLLDAAVGNRS
jgi:DNA-binding transcriptional MerR regulator